MRPVGSILSPSRLDLPRGGQLLHALLDVGAQRKAGLGAGDQAGERAGRAAPAQGGGQVGARVEGRGKGADKGIAGAGGVDGGDGQGADRPGSCLPEKAMAPCAPRVTTTAMPGQPARAAPAARASSRP